MFVKAHKELSGVRKQVDAYNSYLFNNMYKNPTFLNALVGTQASNDSELDDIINQALEAVPVDASIDDVANALFTTNVIKNVYAMGYKSSNLDAALSMFRPESNIMGLLADDSAYFTPSDYIPRDGMFIDDASPGMMGSINVNVVSSYDDQQTCLQNVANKTATANDMANNIDTSATATPFNQLALTVFLIEVVLPIGLILGYYVYTTM